MTSHPDQRLLIREYLTAASALAMLGAPSPAAAIDALPPGTRDDLRVALAREWALRTAYDGDETDLPAIRAAMRGDHGDPTILLLEDALGGSRRPRTGSLAGDGLLIVLIGPAGSGKSTLAESLWEPGEIISLDRLRGQVSDDICDQGATSDAVRVMHVILSARLARRLTTVIDATNTSPRVRSNLIHAAARSGVPAVAVVMDTPFEECVARNSHRDGALPGRPYGRRVPDNAIRRQYDEMHAGLAGLHAEGFTDVINQRGERL